MTVAAEIIPRERQKLASPVLTSRLLVVDHQRAFVGLVRILARSMGYETSAVLDTRELAERVKAWRPTVLVIETAMPDMDGVEIVAVLANNGFRGQLVLVTAHEPACLELARKTAEAKRFRVVACLGKPVRAQDMVRALQLCASAPSSSL